MKSGWLLTGQPATSLYINKRGHIVIQQERAFEGEIVEIYIEPARARLVALAICAIANQSADDLFSEVEGLPGEQPQDRTAAERQRRHRRKKREPRDEPPDVTDPARDEPPDVENTP
jgi:hypothetical protein